MSKIGELFTYSVKREDVDWNGVVKKQHCQYSGKQCFKVRKSQAEISIGTCSVKYGRSNKIAVICPHRLLERGQIFTDCLHLLTSHQPGNEFHLVSEVAVPGGSVDYVLVSTDANRRVKDFVGIELQSLDTSGSWWPERERALQELNVKEKKEIKSTKLGINWKMTAKTILVQLLHKIGTFEGLNKHLVLVVQDCLLDYIKQNFNFNALNDPSDKEPMHFHSYNLIENGDDYKLVLAQRYSTNRDGVCHSIRGKYEKRM